MSEIAKLARDQVDGFLTTVGLNAEKLDDGELLDGILVLVDKLKAYQEEGKELRPEFLVIREKDHKAIMDKYRLTHFFEIVHKEKRTRDLFSNAVKHCAPLAHGVWAGFIKLEDDGTASYGVARRRYGVSEPRVVADGIKEPFVWLRQVERHVVELQGPAAARLELSFRAVPKASGASAFESRQKLLSVMTEKTWSSHKDAVGSWLEDVLDRALLNGHGFLIAVSEAEDEKDKVPAPPAWASGLAFSGWILPTQVKIAELRQWTLRGDPAVHKGEHDAVRAARIDEAVRKAAELSAQVEAWSELASSLLMSDGITWFDNCGRLLGFRLFVASAAIDNSGGARTKAFRALQELVDQKKLRAAFMQSQDGRTAIHP